LASPWINSLPISSSVQLSLHVKLIQTRKQRILRRGVQVHYSWGRGLWESSFQSAAKKSALSLSLTEPPCHVGVIYFTTQRMHSRTQPKLQLHISIINLTATNFTRHGDHIAVCTKAISLSLSLSLSHTHTHTYVNCKCNII
jgi:hypothetical protein